MAVEIVPASPANEEVLLTLMQELYAHERMVFHKTYALTALRKLLSDPSVGGIWLVWDSGTVAGYCVLTYWYSLEFHGKAAFLDELYLRPSYRGAGIGNRIINFLIDKCRKESISALRLEVEIDNTGAQEFYVKRGFVAHDRKLMTKWVE